MADQLDPKPHHDDSDRPTDNTSPGRRKFMAWATIGLGGAISAIMAFPLVRYLLFPMRRKTVSSGAGAADVMADADLVAGAPPVKVQIVGDAVRDAWNVADKVNLGAAWVSKDKSGTITAFTTVCPHLGCAIGFDPGADEYKCPCHNSAFKRSGDKIKGPSKRGLDSLPVVVEEGRVKVTFQRFVQDIAEKKEA